MVANPCKVNSHCGIAVVVVAYIWVGQKWLSGLQKGIVIFEVGIIGAVGWSHFHSQQMIISCEAIRL